MAVTIPLGRMTISDKLRAMETIWDDLQGTPKGVPSPAWHADVLRARESRIRAGRSHFGDWGAAKSRIRKRTK